MRKTSSASHPPWLSSISDCSLKNTTSAYPKRIGAGFFLCFLHQDSTQPAAKHAVCNSRQPFRTKENTRNPKISGVFLELLGGFEPPTSSLPIPIRLISFVITCGIPSLVRHCSTRGSGPFCRKLIYSVMTYFLLFFDVGVGLVWGLSNEDFITTQQETATESLAPSPPSPTTDDPAFQHTLPIDRYGS